MTRWIGASEHSPFLPAAQRPLATVEGLIGALLADTST
jgi:hypothetical protein